MKADPPIDEQALARLQRLGGDRFVLRMIDAFLETMKDRLGAARTGVERGEADTVAQSMHSLKSSAGNFGAVCLRRAAEEMEQQAHAGRLDELPRLLARLEAAAAEVDHALAVQRKDVSP